jgi:hypothetical protein
MVQITEEIARQIMANRAIPQPTYYEQHRDTMLAQLRLYVANMIAKHAREEEIEQVYDDCLSALQSQRFLEGVRFYMLNPDSGTTLPSAVAWTAAKP